MLDGNNIIYKLCALSVHTANTKHFFAAMICRMKFFPMPRSPILPHKRKNARPRQRPKGLAFAFLKRCGIGEKARQEKISNGEHY